MSPTFLMHHQETDTSGAARRAIVWGGVLCGVLDIACALILAMMRGGSPVRLLQSIASAVLGRAAFGGGWWTTALGLGMHFCVAFTLAAIFWVASRQIPILLRQMVPAGLAFGACAYVAMSWGVIPLCAVVRTLYLADVTVRFPKLTLEGLAIHLFCVGLPIAFAAGWASRRTPDAPAAGAHAGA